MDLTIESLIQALTEYNNWNISQIELNTNILDLGTDGDDAIDMLINLGEEFSVDFSKFDFKKYFHDEIEILHALSWFGLKRIRKIESMLTVKILYDYMKDNIIL
jgi:hypothetical protein